MLPTSSPESCGGCGGYFGSSAAARVWCVYINSKRSKKTAPAAPALAGQQSSPTSRPRTLYPESGDRSQRRGIEESRNRIRGSVSPPSDSPLPFPDSGIRLRGTVNLCDTKLISSTHKGVSRVLSALNKSVSSNRIQIYETSLYHKPL